MMKIKIIFVAILVVLIGWFTASRFRKSDKNSQITVNEISKNEIPTEPNEKNQVPTTFNQNNEAKTVGQALDNANGSANVETVEERYKKDGFIQDPNNANRLMKKSVGNDGKEVTTYVDKGDEGFDPTRKTIKNAIETLELKSTLNPADELLTLRPLDMSLQDNLMLFGSFRDDEKDLEIFFSSLTDEDGKSLGKDVVCFTSPKLKINIQKSDKKAVLRADETGYGVVKLSDVLYARFIWAYEKRRTLYGDLLNYKNGAFVKVTAFAAKEVISSQGETLKYCR